MGQDPQHLASLIYQNSTMCRLFSRPRSLPSCKEISKVDQTSLRLFQSIPRVFATSGPVSGDLHE